MTRVHTGALCKNVSSTHRLNPRGTSALNSSGSRVCAKMRRSTVATSCVGAPSHTDEPICWNWSFVKRGRSAPMVYRIWSLVICIFSARSRPQSQMCHSAWKPPGRVMPTFVVGGGGRPRTPVTRTTSVESWVMVMSVREATTSQL